MPGREVIAGPHTGKNPINFADVRRRSRDITANARHDDRQRHLPHIGGFACHIGAGDQRKAVFLALDVSIVGDVIFAADSQLHHGVARRLQNQAIAVIHLRLNISIFLGQRRQTGQTIQPGHTLGSFLDARRLLDDIIPQLRQNLLFQGRQTLIRRLQLIFQLLQFRGDKTLRTNQRLLADIFRRHQIQIGFGNVNIIAKNLIIADTQGFYARALALFGLHSQQNVAALITDITKLINLGITAGADDFLFITAFMHRFAAFLLILLLRCIKQRV